MLTTTNLTGFESLASDWSQVNSEIKELKEKLKILERQKAIIEDGFKEKMEDADLGVMTGWEARWKRASQKRLNQTKLKAEQPELYNSYCEDKPFRRFEIVQTALEKEPEFRF